MAEAAAEDTAPLPICQNSHDKRFGALRRLIGGQEFAEFLGEIDQDRAGFEDAHRCRCRCGPSEPGSWSWG